MSVDAVGTVRRGRGARKVARQTRNIRMLPPLKRKLPLTEPMTPNQIEKIDAASMDILKTSACNFGMISPRPTGKLQVPQGWFTLTVTLCAN